MKFSEALEQIKKAYVPGTVAHYSAQNPDPWQKAHDDMEKILLLKDSSLLELGIQRFANQCLSLIEQFKQLGIQPAQLDAADGFHMGESKINQYYSRKHKTCVKCEKRAKDLRIVPVEGDDLNVVLICGQCRGEMK